ncbi:Hypothetical_protein [Hexamita inflata]|uniref:Hypothetical_protein n=1 Tax=Hexamita inflata TaxID=28002 RepID=A0AA86RN97_9EUKA|nr:Hypothetical protein HINF_LOCUS64313 [Hexamita inflata]
MKPHEQQKEDQTQHLDQQSNQIEFNDLSLNNYQNLTSEHEVCNTQTIGDVSRYINHFPKIQQEEGKYFNGKNLPQRVNFVNPHINRFSIQQIKNIVFYKVPQDYAQIDVIHTEEMLQVILFESKVQAVKLLKYKTTIRNKLSADNQFACVFNDLHTRDFAQKIQNENNELLSIFTQKTINQENQTGIKRCKNECKRTASVLAIKGHTINKTKSRYCHKFEYIVRQNGEINTFKQIQDDKTYYKVVFQKRSHHVGANPCYYRKCVQITSRMLNMFTKQQSLILLDYNLRWQTNDFLW